MICLSQGDILIVLKYVLFPQTQGLGEFFIIIYGEYYLYIKSCILTIWAIN